MKEKFILMLRFLKARYDIDLNDVDVLEKLIKRDLNGCDGFLCPDGEPNCDNCKFKDLWEGDINDKRRSD